MQDALNQIHALTSNPYGIDTGAQEVEQELSATQNELDRTRDQLDAMKVAFGQGQMKPAMLPDEKQLAFLFNTQPKKKDKEDAVDWDEWVLDESEILRHVQLGVMDLAMAKAIRREYADIQILRQQKGKRRVAINAAKKLYWKILLTKSTALENRPTTAEMILNPVSRSEIKQSLEERQLPHKPGFFTNLISR